MIKQAPRRLSHTLGYTAGGGRGLALGSEAGAAGAVASSCSARFIAWMALAMPGVAIDRK